MLENILARENFALTLAEGTDLSDKRPLHTQKHYQFSNSKSLREERKEIVKGMGQD